MIQQVDDGDEWRPAIGDFVQAYRTGPACVWRVRRSRNGTTSSALVEENVRYRQESQSQRELLGEKVETANEGRLQIGNIIWDLTHIEHSHSSTTSYVVCLGKLQEAATSDLHPSRTAITTVETAQPAEGAVGADGSQDHKDWFAAWKTIQVPGLSQEDAHAHIQLLQDIDWEATALGPISSWCPTLLSSVSQCLASAFPVLLAWGPEHIMIYNHAYAGNVYEKHPKILGLSYKDAWPEVWDMLEPVVNAALAGQVTHVNNSEMYLNRGDYLEECYFTWSMIPVFNDSQKAVGIYIPNFDSTVQVITDRRLKLLREASQSFSFDTTVETMFKRVAKSTSRNTVDFPLIAFYDCAASDEVEEESQQSSQERSIFSSHHTSSGEHVRNLQDDPSEVNSATRESLEQSKTGVTFVRSATAGISPGSEVFPAEIPPKKGDSDSGVASHPQFIKYFREVQDHHKIVVLGAEEIAEYSDKLDKTAKGDKITCLCIIPILTLDNNLRGLAIVGLNPRKRYDEDYRVFIDLFQAQLNHGVTSIRLINQEIKRARFLAAVIRRKNEELQHLLQARTEELKSSELKFLKMAEICPAGLWRATIDKQVTFVNEAWWQITSHPRHVSPSSWIESVHEDDRGLAQQAWAECLSGKAITPTEIRWKSDSPDSPPHWSWIVTSPEFDQDGRTIGVIGTLTDITSRKHLEAFQQRRMEEAIELRASQERFVDMTSHEIRNPLSAISLSADASVERLEAVLKPASGALPIEAHQEDINETLSNLKIINHCCMHITRLIDDILTLSKLDNKFLVVTPVPCRPIDFITETFSIFKGEMLAKDIASSLDIRSSLAAHGVDYVLTDPSRVNQLLINLMTNGIKFTARSSFRRIIVTLDCSLTRPTLSGAVDGAASSPPPGGRAASGSPSQNDLYLLVSISDTGCGLSQDEISGLFQRFKQANPKTHISYGGSGLGLFVCRRIVTLLGGEIGVTSTVGKGSVFSFYVPVTLLPTPGTSHSTIPRDGPSPRKRLHQSSSGSELEDIASTEQPISILIVEDNLINQKLLDKHLTRMGCITTCANDGQEALNVIKASRWGMSTGKKIDCVLMDIEMPVMTGLEAIAEIRRLQKAGSLQGKIPVLAVTANARPEQIATMLESGFDGTISKPFRVPAILEKMRKEFSLPSQE